jgi:hypothetical protein
MRHGKIIPHQAATDAGCLLRPRAEGLRLAEVMVEALVTRRLFYCKGCFV